MSKKDKPPISQRALAQEVVGIIKQEYSGPLPPPNALERYNAIIPNGAERIMVMAEEQSKHRRALETKALNTDSRNSLLGVIFAFILGLTTIATGGIVVLKGQPWPGTIIGSAGLVGLVSAFIYGTRERRKERESKAKAS
jgi:uncharacterized membrane protein